jgi:hypothetical protein
MHGTQSSAVSESAVVASFLLQMVTIQLMCDKIGCIHSFSVINIVEKKQKSL